jgi:hypothetical protein
MDLCRQINGLKVAIQVKGEETWENFSELKQDRSLNM